MAEKQKRDLSKCSHPTPSPSAGFRSGFKTGFFGQEQDIESRLRVLSRRYRSLVRSWLSGRELSHHTSELFQRGLREREVNLQIRRKILRLYIQKQISQRKMATTRFCRNSSNGDPRT